MQSLTKQRNSEWLYYKPEGENLVETGLLLKQIRQKRLLTTRDIKKATGIPISYIIAIESGDKSRFPEEFIVRELIERYKIALGLVEQPVVQPENRQQQADPLNQKDAFDLLFQENTGTKTSQFQNTKQNLIKIFSIYIKPVLITRHYIFYFVIGFILLLTTAIVVLKNLIDDSNSYLAKSSYIIENDLNQKKDESSQNFDDTENEDQQISFVDSEGNSSSNNTVEQNLYTEKKTVETETLVPAMQKKPVNNLIKKEKGTVPKKLITIATAPVVKKQMPAVAHKIINNKTFVKKVVVNSTNKQLDKTKKTVTNQAQILNKGRIQLRPLKSINSIAKNKKSAQPINQNVENIQVVKINEPIRLQPIENIHLRPVH